MNIDNVKKILKDNFDCNMVNIFKYENDEFCKAIQILRNGICYRYFIINNNDVNEVIDEVLLSYFRENYEINTEVNY